MLCAVSPQQTQWPVERFFRRSRPYALTVLGLVFVFVLSDGSPLSAVFLLVGGLWYWAPALISSARNFSEGWRTTP
jgi:hypothetical protein